MKVCDAHPCRSTPVRGILETDKARNVQVAQGDVGRAMVSGEFSSMTALHKTIPDATPEPVGWGTYASNPNVHFFICRFIDMIDEVPGLYFLDLFTPFIKIQLGSEECLGTEHHRSSMPSGLLQMLTRNLRRYSNLYS